MDAQSTWAALIAGVVSLGTVWLTYLTRKLNSEATHSGKQDDEIQVLQLQVAACEERDKAKAVQIVCLRTEVDSLVGIVGQLNRTKVTALIETDATGKITAWNAGATVLFGYAEADAIGRDVIIVIPTEKRQTHLTAIKIAIADPTHAIRKEPLYDYAVDKNGRRFPASIKLASWGTGDERKMAAEIREMTPEEFAVASRGA